MSKLATPLSTSKLSKYLELSKNWKFYIKLKIPLPKLIEDENISTLEIEEYFLKLSLQVTRQDSKLDRYSKQPITLEEIFDSLGNQEEAKK